MTIQCPIWLLITIIWLIVSSLLMWSAGKSHGMFGGMDQALGCVAVTGMYLVFMITYFLMK